MATKSISQLDTQATANETDLFEVAIVDANSASGYASKKESGAAIADAIVGEYQYPLRITGTTAKTIAGAINEIESSLAPVATSGAYSDLSGKPTIDTALDDTSTNAVENRAVAGAIEEIESELSSPDISDNEPYLLRDSASGTADRMVDELVGGTVAFNQLIQNGNFASTTGWASGDGISIGATNNELTISVDSDPNNLIRVQGSVSETIIDHIYLQKVDAKSSQVNIMRMYCPADNSTPSFNITTTYSSCYVITKATRNGTSVQPFRLNTTDTKPVGSIYTLKNFNLIDLTQMFGSTIADYIYSLEQAEAGAGVAFFRKLFPEDYYAYNAGELISVKATAHIMRDANDNIIGNYPLDANLELRGLFKLDANNKLYCDGDTYESSGKVTRKYGIVDLGSLAWVFSSSNNGFFYATLANGKQEENYPHIISSNKYHNITTNSYNDKDYHLYGTTSYGGFSRIGIKDNDYISEGVGDATAFKNAVNGIYLVYELATPTTETAASFAGIQVVDGDGTEEYVDSRSVPIPVGHNTTYIHGLNEYRTAVESYLASLDARITALEGASNTRSLSVSPVLTKSLTSDSDKTEGILEAETEEETKEEAQNER